METNNFIPASQLAAAGPTNKVLIGPKEKLPSNIKLHRNGDIIEAIEVKCSCGETLLIRCVYDE